MARKKKRSEEHLSNHEPTRKAQKKPPMFGTDHALTLLSDQGTSLDLSYWDLWFSVAAVMMDDGDLDRLAKRIKVEKGFLYDRQSIERKRCHIRDLKRRLVEASAIPADIVLAAADLAKTEKRRALKKVTESIHKELDLSEPMLNTPRMRRFAHALRGCWHRFPVSPEPYAENVGAHFRSKGVYHKDRSFLIARTLDRYVEKAKKLLEAGKAAQAQALLRGWMTVIIVLIQKADDSFGRIGMSFDEGFTAYLKISLEKTGIDDAVFFSDLLDFLIWEDYGLTDQGIEGYFRQLTKSQADRCVDHLRHEVVTLLDDDLPYETEEALTFLGQVVAEQERFDEFEDLARQMGSRGAWRRTVRLADIANEAEEAPGDEGLRGGDDEGGSPGLPQGEIRETQARPLEPGPAEIV